MSVKHWKIRASIGIKKLDKKIKLFMLFGIIGCIILGTLFLFASGSEVYSLTIAGRNAGYITDTALIDEAVNEIKTDYASKKEPLEVSIDQDKIAYEGAKLDKDEVTSLTVKQLKNKIIASDICTAKGWTINVDGKNIVATASKNDAEQILNGVKKQYLRKDSKLISTDFKENVFITQAAVNISTVMKPDDAVTFILTGEKDPEVYTVKDGDTIWDIAAGNGMSTGELQNANPGFDPNKIKIGQQLNLVALKPYVTVETKELISSTEKIPFNTVYEETSSLNKGEMKIKTAGTFGTKQISSEVTKENGIITATKVVQSVVTAQPQNQVALKGTKTAVRYIASRSSSFSRSASFSASGSDIVAYAEKYLGVPYVHGGSTPDGFDCSGYTQYVMGHFGGSIPRTAASQYSNGAKIDKSQLQPGDLVFFKPSSTSSNISHVGIYVGGGKFIHSPQPGENVKISDLSNSYNLMHYYGAARVTN